MPEHLHGNGLGMWRGRNESFGFPCACVCARALFYFIHTNADELRGSARQQWLKLAFYICRHLPARHRSRHTAQRKVFHVRLSLGWRIQAAAETWSGPRPMGARGQKITDLTSQEVPSNPYTLIPHITYESMRPQLVVSKGRIRTQLENFVRMTAEKLVLFLLKRKDFVINSF